MSLPNIITLIRILLVPVVIWAIASGRAQLAFWLFMAAGISDALDGLIAKKFGMQTELGAYLDPLADKALLVSIYVALAATALVPSWVAIAVVTRDVLIVGAVLLSQVLHRPVAIAPLLVSKANTLAQICLAALVLASAGFGIEAPELLELGLVAVGLLTGVSAAAYLAEWTRHMAK